MQPEVKIGEWIEKGFRLYKENLGLLIGAGVVAGLISIVTMGILAGPMMAGLILIVLDLIDSKPKPEFSRLFNGFEFFAHSFLFVIVWGVIYFVAAVIMMLPCVGQMVYIAGSVVLAALLAFGLFLIVDRRMAFWPASMESIKTVKTQFWPLLAYLVISGIIGEIGAILCGIGALVTMPLGVCLIAVAYREFFPVAGVAQAQPDTSQPPGSPAT